MKRFYTQTVWMLSLALLTACAGGSSGSDTGNDPEQNQTESIDPPVTTGKSLYLYEGMGDKYYGVLNVSLSITALKNQYLSASTYFQPLPTAATKRLISGTVDRSCVVIVPDDGDVDQAENSGPDGGSDNIADPLSAGDLLLGTTNFMSPDVYNIYHVDNLSGLTPGTQFSFSYKGDSTTIDNDTFVIPAFGNTLYLSDPGSLKVNGQVVSDQIALVDIAKMTWSPMLDNVYSQTATQITVGYQLVSVAVYDRHDDFLGSIECSLYASESSLASVLEDENIKVSDLISDLGGAEETVTISVRQIYKVGVLVGEDGGMSASATTSKTYELDAE